jgi:hypothetical protein
MPRRCDNGATASSPAHAWLNVLMTVVRWLVIVAMSAFHRIIHTATTARANAFFIMVTSTDSLITTRLVDSAV